MDFKIICRICLEANRHSSDLFSSYYPKRNTLYSEMLASCTKLKPLPEDGLPRLICKECTKQLKRTYTFNMLCEESNKTLIQFLQDSHKVEITINGDELVNNENFIIKSEDGSIKTDDSYVLEMLNQNVAEVMKTDIKLEQPYSDASDNFWDADDNSLLTEIKLNDVTEEGELEPIGQDLVAIEQEPLKKKRGRKKKKQPYSDASDNFWDADDNSLLTEIKLNDVTEEGELEPIGQDLVAIEQEPLKKKRGRKKKILYEGEVPAALGSKGPHQCDICGKVLSTKSNLEAHKVCHTDLRPYCCPECPATFRGHSALFQHKRIHSGETPYHCEYCPKRFSRRTGLVNHIRMHEGDKKYSCDICSKRFVQSAQYTTHMKRHKGDKPYLCHDCGKGFTIKAELRVHQRVHNGEKPYSCHLCSKTFATCGNLSTHIRIHSREIRYNCKECQRGFVSLSSYNVHLKRHKGQRDHHCECGKTFYTTSALKQHTVVHTGEKKHQCKICDRKFSQTSHLNRHFKRDHAKPNTPKPSLDQYRMLLEFDKKENHVETPVNADNKHPVGEKTQNLNENIIEDVDKLLLKQAKVRGQEKSYKFVWVINTTIFLRKDEESPVIEISAVKDLQKIV